MNKRWISLIIILAVVGSLGFIQFGDKYIVPLFSQPEQGKVWEYAHGVDRNGNIYYIRQEQGQVFLISLDSTGRQSFKKDISALVPDNGIFDGIYTDEDKNLYLPAYGMAADSSLITQVGIYRFRDDGSFVSRVFYRSAERPYDSKFRLISAMSDDDARLYFGFLNGDALDTYAYDKTTAKLENTHSYSLAGLQDKINAVLVLPSGDTVLSLENATLLRKSNRHEDTAYQFTQGNKVIIHSFWYAGNQLYFQDAVRGDMYMSSSSTWEPYLAVRGSKVVSENDGITFARLYPLTVGNIGNVAGVYNEGNHNRIFQGGFAFLPEIGTTDASSTRDLTAWFLLVGIAAGGIIFSLLLWDFYCHILHMRLSMLIRQALLVIFVIFLTLYALATYIIIPQSEAMIGSVHSTEQLKSGQMLLASAKGHIADETGLELDSTRAAAFFDQLGENQSLVLPGEEQGTPAYRSLKEAQLSLLTSNQGQYVVAASNSNYEEGFPAARMGYGKDFLNGIQQAEQNTIQAMAITGPKGEELCVFIPTGLTSAGSAVIFSLTVDREVLERYIAQTTGDLTLYMGLIGLVLVLLVMIVEYFTVHNVRKLKSNVDRIAEGRYEKEVAVSSGDEIEDLSHSIHALSQSILTTTRSLNKLNQSYYRFVPQRFLEIIGETHIENVGKKSQAQKENVVMLFLRFRFIGPVGEQSQEIFANINDVFENVAPVVSEGKGTVYDFLPEGFNAVFETPPEEALRTALRVREVLEGLNEKRRKKGQSLVDLRILITKGSIMLGFIGEEKRMEPTAISSEAQKAEPIIRVCFESDIYIACTREVIKELPILGYRRRRIGEMVIQGEKLELYDLFDSDPYALLKSKEVHGERFELGVNLFIKRDYDNARTMFMDIIKYNSLDGAARNYMYLAEHNLRSELKQTTYTTISELEKIR
ncbi:HAMP domain-containing protein [Desulfitobacterium chlororespirans]|uniref:HAMP domain-containing protein n=1 Tax=Desulfitobacterium chlororespirans DSM 11544 TaxID=1121395 RepID=A0A1M7TZG4_9FIRM|nr:HAMP domain-containing protein [Desulfitobacterium chlororespirans]SHN76098.1 HAMP domain-containing protein [Desulfitobacterium chlororespirans DSM 11544]